MFRFLGRFAGLDRFGSSCDCPQLTAGLMFLIALLWSNDHANAADVDTLSPRDRQIVVTVESTVRRAGRAFASDDYEASGEAVAAAMRQIKIAMNAADGILFDALLPSIDRVANARAMLELEGITLPPFRRPERPPDAKPSDDSTMTSASSSGTNVVFNTNSLVMDVTPSFTKTVAPILVNKCGRCHVDGNRGGFSMRTFNDLMTGPAEGVVVFAGDPIGSRLIETIETGDMPRGGTRVTPQELNALKAWVSAGAKFDGESADVVLTSLTTSVASPAAPTPTRTEAPSGMETVSFATDIAPILVDNCVGCHIDAMQTRGGLRMDTLAQLLRGGDSGAVIAPGRGDDSLIVQKLRGMAGDRMPAGGRPPLSEGQIQLIATWIDEGSKLEPNLVQTPVGELSRIAWVNQSTPEQMTQRRHELAQRHFAMASVDATRLSTTTTDHFQAYGDVAPSTLGLVARQAEKALAEADTIWPPSRIAGQPETIFHGLATLYVLPRRYDYSEFATMVERRGIPAHWQSHWHSDGLSTYVALVATDRDEADDLGQRLLAPVVSLAISSMGSDIPRWFADGIGRAIAMRDNGQDRIAREAAQSDLMTAIGSLKDGAAFFDGSLPPERADRLAAAVCGSMLQSSRLRKLKMVMLELEKGMRFEDAFAKGMSTTPAAYFDAWLAYAKR
ncbi:MAG: c-type cytochrome domain-containing protein [Planctomycetota bacterium]